MRMAMQFDDIQMIKEAVALGSGISILPALTMLAEVEQGWLVAIPLHAPELVRRVGIVPRKRKKFNRVAQSFLEFLQEAPDRAGVGWADLFSRQARQERQENQGRNRGAVYVGWLVVDLGAGSGLHRDRLTFLRASRFFNWLFMWAIISSAVLKGP